MDLDKEELKATNPGALEKEIKLLKEKNKQLEKMLEHYKSEVKFYKEIYYGKEDY